MSLKFLAQRDKKKRYSESNAVAPQYVKILGLSCEDSRPALMKALCIFYMKVGE